MGVDCRVPRPRLDTSYLPRRRFASVPTCLSTLRADDVRSSGARLVHVLRVSDHVHVQDPMGMQLVDDVSGRDADGGDEEFRPAGNDDVDQFVERAFGVVKLVSGHRSAEHNTDAGDTPRPASGMDDWEIHDKT